MPAGREPLLKFAVKNKEHARAFHNVTSCRLLPFHATIVAHMEAFDKLVSIIDSLLGPGGCPWDQKQTLDSMRASVLEEVTELIESIDSKNSDEIKGELGDFFFNALFLCRLAEKEGHCDLTGVIEGITEKMIRRHPHVFGDTTAGDADALLSQWERIKQGEKAHAHRKSALDGIPKTLPALAHAQKMCKKMKKNGFNHPLLDAPTFDDEQSLGALLLSITNQAATQGLDAELALRRASREASASFRKWEDG